MRYKYKNNFGDLLNVDHGILQGDTISPVPFSLCVNDLEHSYIISNCKDVSIQDLPMFLMRMTWFYSLTRLMVCKKTIDILYSYCNDWNIAVNVSKIKIV